MSALIVKALVRKTLKDTATKNINSANPFEEEVEVLDRRGQPTGKVRTQKRAIPNGLTDNDTRVLKKVRRRAYRLDMSLFNCCGIRFGWSSVIGIIPVIGDFIDAFMALMIVRACAAIDGGLPQTLRARMIFNVLLDFGIGLVPFVGDLADAVFRANTRNAWLLEVYLTKKMEAQKKGHVSDEDLGTLEMPPRPPNAQLPASDTRGGGFVSQGRTRPADEEMATGVIDAGHVPPSKGWRSKLSGAR